MDRQGPRVGFIGLGNMGWPMARHLVEGGIAPMVLDAVPERAAAFAREIGGHAASDLPELGREAEIIVTMLPNGDVVRTVVLGETGCRG